jgi:hypothetical protein
MHPPEDDGGVAVLRATLSVEGRACAARPLSGCAVGHVAGVAVLADSEHAMHEAEAWMPGRILVLTDDRIPHRVIDALLAEARATTFAAIVVLCHDDADLGRLGDARLGIPIVVVTRPTDRERVRRAVRLSLSVQPAQAGPSVRGRHHVRHAGRRHVDGPVATQVPGTVHDRRIRL